MSIDKPTVSIIIPVYNTEEYLEECLDSVLNQTLKDIEIICIDDKSSDKSLDILLEYAKKDNRLKLIQHKENKGQSIARNTALKQVNGEYISFLDSDDKLDLDACEKLYDFTKDTKQDVILYNIVRFNEKKVQESELHIKSENNIKKTNLLENPDLIYDTVCNKFIKTSFLVENDLEFVDKLYEDILFSMQILTKTKSIGVYNDTNYYWRKRKNTNKSVTQKRTDIKNIKDRIFIIKEVISLFENSEYNFIMDNLYKKLLEIDFRLYINQIDRANDEYKKVILDEMLPILKTIPDNVFENLNSLEKIKYDLLLSEKIDELEYLTSKQREHKKLKKQNSKLTKKTKKQKDKNKKLKKEIKVLKSTKGWIKYKLNNIYNRLFK